MLKQQLAIPEKNAEKLIFELTRHSTHFSGMFDWTETSIKTFFESNGYPWHNEVGGKIQTILRRN